MGRCPLFRDQQPAALRIVGPCELPTIDTSTVQEGCAEFVVQEIAGRRLEDRVLDALRLCELAGRFETVDSERVRFEAPRHVAPRDEVLIADELRSGGLIP